MVPALISFSKYSIDDLIAYFFIAIITLLHVVVMNNITTFHSFIHYTITENPLWKGKLASEVQVPESRRCEVWPRGLRRKAGRSTSGS